MAQNTFSTGISGLDRVFRGLLPGDNLVWHVDEIADFQPFVPGTLRAAAQGGRRLIYFRFAEHAPLLDSGGDGSNGTDVEVRMLDASSGFERFVTAVRAALRDAGTGAYFVFDSLSALAELWSSDRMLGNFFMLTCPYVYDMESIAHFPLLRGRHSIQATEPITRTTQIFTEVYRHQSRIHIQPTKVEHRFSPTMYMLHAWQGEAFTPISDSATIAEILTARPWPGLDAVRFRLGKWNRTFLDAERVWTRQQQGKATPEEVHEVFCTLVTMLFSRDERVLGVAMRFLDLGDLLAIWRRMIGTGLIGGKSVGMLLARAILRRTHPRWETLLEAHDSFFIGSDIFYSFLVDNGCWMYRQRQSADADDLHEARRRIITGRFPDELLREFGELLDYFSQSPIIVRSSSLLEDSYGNAFAGKYESVFCANLGSQQKRLNDFVAAVKTIYASALSAKALRYRAQRGLLDCDEQMSLLVQRVSGSRHGSHFFPQVAGVALSRNPYVWNPLIDPRAGMMRLVFGLGTRAVERADDDYTRVVALNVPRRRPESGIDEVRQYSQRRVDLIDLDASQVVAVEFAALAATDHDVPLAIFASPDRGQFDDQGDAPATPPLLLTFDHLLSRTPFVADMREMLRILEASYDHPVDTEFTANFTSDGDYRINLVQCRPLQVAEDVTAVVEPALIGTGNLVLASRGAVIGTSRQIAIDRVVYVSPAAYAALGLQDRYAVARLIGRVLHHSGRDERCTLLVGPGRWGTTTPTLGVPVHFAEIDTVAVLCEIVTMRDGLIPDVSLGTHFFNDLVEMDMLYLALFPGRDGHEWNPGFFEQTPNRLGDLLPDAMRYAPVVRVIDLPLSPSAGAPPGTTPVTAGAAPTPAPAPFQVQATTGLTLWADALEQRVLGYLDCPELAGATNGGLIGTNPAPLRPMPPPT